MSNVRYCVVGLISYICWVFAEQIVEPTMWHILIRVIKSNSVVDYVQLYYIFSIGFNS